LTTLSNITLIKDTPANQIQKVFELQKSNQYNVARTSYKERKKKLKSLQKALFKYRQKIKDAMYQDFKKNPSEVDLTELYPVFSQIKYTIRHLRSWMQGERVPTPLALLGSSSKIVYEPKGVVLIISPWNFPFNLTFDPLISAIAAGNCVMLKPSELTPNSSEVMKEMISELFQPNEVALVEGGISTSQALLSLPFNHIFFTGSPRVGKIVMSAASQHLTSVTLELGGKSPTIIDETANIKLAAQRIVWGKFMNNGQICIAPDHIYIHESKKDQFIDLAKQFLIQYYGEDAAKSKDYARIVNKGHFNRLKETLDDAIAHNAIVEFGGDCDESSNYIQPTLLSDPSPSSRIMKEEIFGPLIPIISYSKLDEVIHKVNSEEKPLAIYIYSKSNRNIEKLVRETRAGGVSINQNTAHVSNINLPFGGVNNSGIGKRNGMEGFKECSNAKAVFRQHFFSASDLLAPPYTSWKQNLIDLTLKYL
jgi:aldehyde dehydrogenase (NAD+)